MGPFDFYLRTRVVFGEGTFQRLGELSRDLGFTRVLIVSDAGIVATGLVAKAVDIPAIIPPRPLSLGRREVSPRQSRPRPEAPGVPRRPYEQRRTARCVVRR